MGVTTDYKMYASSHGKNSGGGGTTIIMGGNTSIPENLNVTSINADQGNIRILNGNSMTFNDAKFIYMAADDGTIVKLRGDEIAYNAGRISDLHSDLVTTDKLKANQIEVDDYGWIKSLQSNNITTEYLTVTKQAHFFELIIDKIRSVGGTLMMTQANCVADYVKAYTSTNVEVILDYDKIKDEHPEWSDQQIKDAIDSRLDTVDHFDIFFLSTDNTGRNITNDWITDDQALCQSFNNVSTGANYNVSNKYYWRLVTDILDDRYMNLNTGSELALNQTTQATKNTVTITAPYVTVDMGGTESSHIDTGWNTVAQTIPGIVTGVTWEQTSGGLDSQTIGVMQTTNTVFGIQISPMEDANILNAIPKKFGFICSAARLNVGIYFTDGTSKFFAAPENAKTSYEYEVDGTSTIEVILITNADDVEWKLVHGIRLSNTDCSLVANADASYIYNTIPCKGDNIVQLGYRYQNVSGYPTNGTDAQKKAWIEANGPIYDRSAAQIISTYKSPDSDVRPPAYAQYTGINDYNLPNHRGTYIDATGGYFKGKLVTTNGTQIDITDQGLSIDVDFYKIVPNYNIITITNNVISPSTLQVNFLIPGSTTLSSTVPTNCTFNYSIDGATATVINSGLQVSINLSSMTASSYIVMNLLENNEIIDSVRMTVTELQTIQGATGKNGQYSQDAYKNATESQASQSGFVPSSSTSTYPPSGWSAAATTPNFAAGQYTWCITRTVTFDANNNPVYGAWGGLHRITGDNGQPGEDGKYTEFIYRRFKTPPTWGNNNLKPSYWAASDTPDYLGLAYSTTNSDSPNNKWTDNPRGVNETYQYEYVASRTYDGEHFSKFDVVNGVGQEPAVWAKWGEKGQDGDGVEYIFRHYTTEQTYWPNNNNNPCYWDANQTDEYLGPSGYIWSDEPEGVNSTYKYEYYAIRTKKLDGNDNVVKWGKYNENSGTPKLWNKWVTDGATGPTGPQGETGPQGDDAEYDVLIPVRETFEVTIGADQVGTNNYENITGQLYTDLIYAVAHIKGDNVTYMNSSQLNSYKLNIRSKYGTTTAGSTSSFDSTTKTSVTINGTSCYALRYQTNNLLTQMWPDNTNRQDYYWLFRNNYMSFAPTQVNVTLVNTSTSKNLDSRDVQLIFKPSNLFSVTERALNSIYQGFSGNTSGSYKTGMSQVYQDWQTIQTTVADIEDDYVNQSKLTQTANQIQSTISKMRTGGNNMVWGSASLKEVNSNTGDPYVFHPQELTPSLSYGINDLYGVYKYHSSGASTYDVLCANYVEVLPNTEYVMSFWAKGYGTIVSHMYYGNNIDIGARCENDEGDVNNHADGYITHTLTSGWKRHWVKYTTVANLPSDHNIKFIFARIPQNTTGYVYICGPKIELGNVPSDWSPAPEDDAQYVQSQITQKADEILMRVGNCGIDITNERISLNGDTEVHGTLTLDDEGQGFILEGAQGKTQISPQSIGTYDNFSQMASSTQSGGKSILAPVNGSGDATLAFEQNFGNVNSGQTISIANIIVQTKNTQGNTISSYSHSTTFAAYVDGNLQSRNNTFTTTRSGTLTIRCEVDVTMTSTYYYQYIILGAKYEVSIPTSDTYTLIGYDGIASKYNNGITYFGSGCSVMKYGQHGLRVDDTGIQKTWNNGSTWRRINSLICTTTVSNYTIQQNDELITCLNSTSISLTFPAAGDYTGRIIYVKSTGSGQIRCQGSYFIQPDTRNTLTSYNMDDHLTIFISDGGRWIVGLM